jgi:hypothetical protein
VSKAIIRDYRPEDREAVRRIAFETGMMGDSIASQYRDLPSFADMLTAYYTDVEPHNALVAELDGKVVGYMLSCRDTRTVWKPERIALKHAIFRGIVFRPGTAAFYWRGLWDMLADVARPKPPPVDFARFPSTIHINLLPEGRGASVGKEFFFRVFDKLKRAGSPGVHGEVLAENSGMLDFVVNKLGYELVDPTYPLPGMRLKNGGRVWIRLITRDLTHWVPEAWLKETKPRRPAEKLQR